MQRYIFAGAYLLFWLCLSASCTSIKRTEHLTNPQLSSFYPMTIQKIEAVCVDTLREASRRNYRPYPERPAPGPIKGFVFNVYFSLQFTDPKRGRDEPFSLLIELPDGNTFECTSQDDDVYSSNAFGDKLIIEVFTTEKGAAKATLGFLNDTGEFAYDFDNPFRSKIARLE